MSLLTITLTLFSGLAAGVLSGLFGVGGGTLIVPYLMLQSLSIHQAVALSLVYVFFTSLSGSYANWRRQMLDPPTIVLIALSASISIFAGVHLTHRLSQTQMAGIFAGFVLIVMASFLWRQKHPLNRSAAEADNAVQGWKRRTILLAIGLLAGLVSSLLGVGGGIILVPMLVLFCGQDIRQATCNSLGGVCLISLIGLIQHALFGQLLPGLARFGPAALLLMSLAGMLAAPLGVKLNRKLPEWSLQLGFLLLCLAVAGFMLVNTRS
jgi:uncharacterized membrane protein YfcA